MTNDIIKFLTTSESVGIIHTWIYNSLRFRHMNYGFWYMAYENNLHDNTNTHSKPEGLRYSGKYAQKLSFNIVSLYYNECSDKNRLIPIDDSIIGLGTDWYPGPPISNDIDKCINKTIKEWCDHVEALHKHSRLVSALESGKYKSGIIHEGNIDQVKEGIIDWLTDPGQDGAVELIRSTIVYEAVREIKDNLLDLNYTINE